MCHRHTPSSKRNLSTKVFAKSAVTCFLPLTKDFNTFYPGPANLVGLFSGSSRPRPAPLLLAPVPACLPSDGHQLAPSCASQPRAAPACACPFLSACSFLPARPCLLRPCLLRHLPAPAPAACACCRSRACPRLFAVRWSPACPFLRPSVPVSPSLRRLVAVTHVITPSASPQATRPAIRFCSSRATIFRPLRFPSLSLTPLPHLPQLALSCLSLQPLPHLRLSAPVHPFCASPPCPPRAVRTRPLSTHASF